MKRSRPEPQPPTPTEIEEAVKALVRVAKRYRDCGDSAREEGVLKALHSFKEAVRTAKREVLL